MNRFRTDTESILAADIGGSFMRMAAMAPPSHPAGPTIRRKTASDDLNSFIAAIEDMAAELTATGRPDAPLVMAIAGTIDPDTGVVTTANIPCLNGVAPGPTLSDRLGRPVALVNDADAFALAEATIGAGQGHGIVFGAVLGTGIGGGLIVDGHAVQGARGVAGEWGHGAIANQHPARLGRYLPRMRCGCGLEGCVDTFGGARGLERLHLALGHRAAESHRIIEDWKSGLPGATLTVEVWAELVSEPLALTLNITGATIVPAGGGLGSEPALIDLLDRAVRTRLQRGKAPPIVVPGVLSPDAGLIGAAILGHQALEAGH